MFGILLVDKPEGVTSHDVVNSIRRRLHTRRVGHAGTLDPLATGTLVVAVGPATRFLQYLPLEPKVYVGVIRFGVETDTMDREGQVINTQDVPHDLKDKVEDTLPRFRGRIEQLPPMHSAIKKDGKPLYEYARQGQEVERRLRKVHIDQLEVLSSDDRDFTVRVVCSGGTYIRSLANDIGQTVGCGAHLAALRREAVGRFTLDAAIGLDAVDENHLIPLKDALPPMPLAPLTEEQSIDIRLGRHVPYKGLNEGELVGLIGPTDEVIGIARVENEGLQPECVIPVEAYL